MSKLDKLKIRLKSVPKDFTYLEVRKLLTSIGFVESTKGKHQAQESNSIGTMTRE